MPETSADIHVLDAALQDGWIILTPNHRTAVQVHENYGAHLKLHSQVTIRPSPKIFPIDIWLRSISQDLLTNENTLQPDTVLESFQELILWKKIIAERDYANPLLKLENSASKVLEAHRLLIQWQISVEELKAYQNKISGFNHLDDCMAFLHWIRKYQDYCRKEKLISFSELLRDLLPSIEKNNALLPEKIILLGFTDPPPLYRQLFSILKKTVKLNELQLKSMTPMIKKQSYADMLAEINAAAKWGKEVLESNPNAKIGIISSELTSQHSLFQSIFSSTFSHSEDKAASFFIESAIRLASDFPIFLELAELLKLNQEELPTEEVCHILRSPLLLAQEEENARAALEKFLRKKQQSIIRSAQLRSLLKNEQRQWHSPELAQALEKCENLRRQQNRLQNIQNWADFFAKQLEILTWSNNEISQQEQFLISCWQQVLEDLKKLAFLHKKLTFTEAYNLLKQLLRDFSYSENRQEAPVQLLTPNDARGLHFTHTWFMGLSDLQWPAFQYPNPFIPVSLQKTAQLPESSAELSYENAKKLLLETQANTSEQLVFSYPKTNADGELLPSPLIDFIDDAAVFSDNPNMGSSLHLHSSSLETYFAASQTVSTEYLEETAYLPLTDSENLKGGSSLIANQAECPFRAFAIHRLHAEELKEFVYGIPATDIGSAIHLILEKLWENLKNQKSISNLDEDELQQIISTACMTGIEYLRKAHGHIFQPAFAELEKQRLITLSRKWLEQEKLRSAFEVTQREFSTQWQYADLTLDLKIDRIDKIDNGFALIDYKSGSRIPRITADNRPSDPQLLLYSAALDQHKLFNPVNALLYAQVNISSLSYQGISLDNKTSPATGLTELRQFKEFSSWEELKQSWNQALNNLAQEFLDGFIAISPKAASSCQYCHLKALCRIQEKNLRDEGVYHD